MEERVAWFLVAWSGAVTAVSAVLLLRAERMRRQLESLRGALALIGGSPRLRVLPGGRKAPRSDRAPSKL